MQIKDNSTNSVVAWKSSFLIKLISLILLCAILCTATFAWISMNIQTDSNGLEMKISVSPNLVISDNSLAIANYSVANFGDSYITKTWSNDAIELIPVDHYDSNTYPNVVGENENNYNLVYNTNPDVVVRNTGKGNNLTFDYVPADGINTYFIDKVIYIASLDKAMVKDEDYSTMTFTISEIGTGTATNIAYKSASVDVYVDGSFKGTLNLDTLNTFSINDLSTIPLNTSGSSIAITLRCYFDGALQNANDATKNYVNSSSLAINTANIYFDISIEVS